MIVCVYALLSGSADLPRRTGAGGERLDTLTAGSVTAVFGRLSRVRAPTVSNLRAYDRVVRALAAHAPAILPARYGTSAADEDELRFILRSRQVSLRRALASVRNRVQMTVRIAATSHEPTPGVSRVPDRRRETGTGYLRARAADAARERHVPHLEPVQTAVRRWVRAARVEKRDGVISVYHLIPRRSVEAYRSALEDAAGRAGLRLRLSGPWPPYAFADPGRIGA